MSEILETFPSQEEIDEIFNKYKEPYVPEGNTEEAPVYKATPKNCGPKPISITTYWKKPKTKEPIEETKTKRNKRGGRKLKQKKEKAELVRLMGLTTGEEKRRFYIQLKKMSIK